LAGEQQGHSEAERPAKTEIECGLCVDVDESQVAEEAASAKRHIIERGNWFSSRDGLS
jgi:hypothetical protein